MTIDAPNLITYLDEYDHLFEFHRQTRDVKEYLEILKG